MNDGKLYQFIDKQIAKGRVSGVPKFTYLINDGAWFLINAV